ncbi:MAG: N-acetyl-gamma-glutamyl-phosphate reductase [Chloroflexota bacterium]|nr:N-acetyl-gamma-glutamyl-phosphate reductase [Dehalococcoidia bacterium]MDW8254669.1 N-acetyl-gamma-glutamyl-phosphate reductase [Chloroflexota bacterium]
MNVGILNVTGYAGLELARLLARHPHVTLHAVTGRSDAGKALDEVFQSLTGLDLPIVSELPDDVEFVFSGLPHKASAEALLPFIDRGIPVVDLAADFRLHDPAEYQRWYNVAPPRPALLAQAVYGLTEIHRAEIAGARLVANPGCYPTAALLAVIPAIAAGIAKPDVIVDAKSGISGGGRSLALANHYSEVNENVTPYSVSGHRHLPEIVQELAALTASPPAVTFIPHLVPMTRGILASCYLPLADTVEEDPPALQRRVTDLYHDWYDREPFVFVSKTPPSTKATYGSNRALLYPVVDARARRLVVFSAIDNLVKGASGQAIQNMNVMLGWPETLGLEGLPVYP